MVFDNAVDPDALLQFLPAASTARIVITSTDRAFTELGQQVDVDAFSRAESVAYLRQRTEDQDANGAAELAAELGDLPVALAQAAATIRGQRLTYQRYLDRLRRVSVAELLGPAAGQGYRHATAAALLLSIENAEGQNPSGLTGMLLRLVARCPQREFLENSSARCSSTILTKRARSIRHSAPVSGDRCCPGRSAATR